MKSDRETNLSCSADSAGPKIMVNKIDVYRDHPEWKKHERWFQMPIPLLDELYVCSYEVRGEYIFDDDMERHAQELYSMHPNCILIGLFRR